MQQAGSRRRAGSAVFVPPPPGRAPALLADLERLVHQKSPKLAPSLPRLVRVALVHVQFETIHPFLDGNHRRPILRGQSVA